jgi:DNA-binding transcriptional MerR regulator
LGLLARPPRSSGGYRDYPGQTLERVFLIQRALAVGFSLPELCAILKIRDTGGVPCQRVRALAGEKLAEVDEKIRELVTLRKQLTQTLKSWDAKLARTGSSEQARLLDALPGRVAVLRGPSLSPKNRKGGRR